MGTVINGEKYGNRWGYCIKGFIMELFLGVIYAWSIFKNPLQAALNLTDMQVTLTYSFSMSFFCIGQFTGAIWGRKLGTVRAITIFGTLVAIFFFCISFAPGIGQAWYLWLMYGVLSSYCVGVTNNNLLSFAPRWFPDKTAFALGVICMGFGLSSLLLGTICTKMIYGSVGLVWTFRICGIAAFIMVALVSLLMKVPPVGYKPEGWEPDGESDTSKGLTRGQMCKQWRFWMMYIWYFMDHFGAYMVLSCIVPYGIINGMDPMRAAFAGGILGVANACGRPILGAVCDNIGRKLAMIIDAIFMIAGLIFLIYLPQVMNPLAGTIIAAICIGFSLGGSITIGNSHLREYYGSRHIGSLMGIICTPDLPTGIIGPIIASHMLTSTGSYVPAFWIAVVCVIISIPFIFLIGKPVNLDDFEQR